MVLLSNSTTQTLQPGQSVTFDTTIVKDGCNECHRNNSSSVKMRTCGLYEVTFSGNIGGTVAGDVEIALAIGGEILNETRMKMPIFATGDLSNVSTTTVIRNGCVDYNRVTVTNTGTAAVVVDANSALFIKRIAC